MMNRSALQAATIVAAAFTGPAAAQESITITSFTGPWETTARECFVEPFTAKTGIKVLMEPGVSSVTFAKLRQQKGAPAIDVAWMNGGDSENAWDEGLLDAIEPDKLSNLGKISDRGVYRTGDAIYAVSTGYFALTIVYNTEKVATPPQSWWDLWKEEYAGRVFSLGPAGTLFAPLLMHLNDELGGTSDDFTPIIDKFAQLDVSTYYSSSGAIQAAIYSGDAIIGSYYTNTAWTLVDQGLPIAVANPKEGLPAADQRLHLVHGSPNKAAAEKFIDFSLGEEPLICMAERMSVGPPLKSVTLGEDVEKRMPWGAGGSVDDLVIPDWRKVNEVRQQITDLWNRRVVEN